jgi:hypothetical protein
VILAGKWEDTYVLVQKNLCIELFRIER